jgi:hypothetical protein
MKIHCTLPQWYNPALFKNTSTLDCTKNFKIPSKLNAECRLFPISINLIFFNPIHSWKYHRHKTGIRKYFYPQSKYIFTSVSEMKTIPGDNLAVRIFFIIYLCNIINKVRKGNWKLQLQPNSIRIKITLCSWFYHLIINHISSYYTNYQYGSRSYILSLSDLM